MLFICIGNYQGSGLSPAGSFRLTKLIEKAKKGKIEEDLQNMKKIMMTTMYSSY